MLQWVKTRLVIEKRNTHVKYYPKVVSADVTYSYPLTLPSADITIAKTGAEDYISPVRFADIVWLQVSVRMSPYEKDVWETIFAGRIESTESEYSNNNMITLHCVGFEVEAFYGLIDDKLDWNSETDARSILETITGYMGWMQYSASYADTGALLPEYHIASQEMFVSEIWEDLEKFSGYKYSLQVVPGITDGNFDPEATYIHWKEFPTTPTDKFKIIEGTRRLLKANFEVSGEDLKAYIKVFGATAIDLGLDTPYNGVASDAGVWDEYGRLARVETYSWLNSNLLCEKIALGLMEDAKQLKVSGQVTIIGTPTAKLCDLVYVKIPSIELNGSTLDDNFTIYKIQHHIDEGTFTTTLDLGKIKKDPYEYYKYIAKTAKVTKQNQRKCKG